MDYAQLRKSILHLICNFPEKTVKLGALSNKEVWESNDKQTLLNELSELLIVPECTLRIAEYFAPILLELLNRSAIKSKHSGNVYDHERICVALGKLVWLFPEASRFSYVYFEKSPNPFIRYMQTRTPPMKKKKIAIEEKCDLVVLLVAVHQLLAFDLKYYKNKWDWSVLSSFRDTDSINVRWLAHQCIFQISDIKYDEQKELLKPKFTDEKIRTLSIRFSDIFSFRSEYDVLKLNRESNIEEDIQNAGKEILAISAEDLSEDVICVEGVLLRMFSEEKSKNMPINMKTLKELVLVPSLKESLEELALAVSAGVPVLIQGPVGCGKTSLVEYLAQLTGRKVSKDLIKVQLGDQTDNKLLIGSYCCTEVPGEFVWKPGVLTEAMTSGRWLLLEDIDSAPMDIISVLSPIIQTQTLTLSGYTEPIKARPGFHLFATQRLHIASGKSYFATKNSAQILNKMWRKITVRNLSSEETSQVISKKWPSISPGAIKRILKIYRMFCVDDEDECMLIEDLEDQCVTQKFIHHGRPICSRDLFKFCDRIAKDLDHRLKSEETFAFVFLNALDSFCDSLPDLHLRLQAATLIGAEFGLSQSKVEYFCNKYKPEISDANLKSSIRIGRITLSVKPILPTFERKQCIAFAHTRQAVYLLEKVAVSMFQNEPVLLVGETGAGKTSIVQYLAHLTNNKLSVINMNQQSDSVDLLGGYKPVDMKLIISPLKEEYQQLFIVTFSEKQNEKFLGHILKCYRNKMWPMLFTLMKHTITSAIKKFQNKSFLPDGDKELLKRWKALKDRVYKQEQQLKHSNNPLAFSFIEGALVKAMKQGEWILLDEINLAETETLQCLAGVLESSERNLYLIEKGDDDFVEKHDNFRLFACMNPATDVGKKDLPAGIRNRFTEFFMDELEDRNDLIIIIQSYLSALALNHSVIESIVNFYLLVRREAATKLIDGTGHRPHYSLRTLCRALSYAGTNPCGNTLRSLYEAFAMSFLSQLDKSSHKIVNDMIVQILLGKGHAAVLKQRIPQPHVGNYIPIQDYWIHAGGQTPHMMEEYIITPSVEKNLHNLARIVSAGKYPVLLQGDTSVGKTSLVMYLARATGNVCVRVNNHEHTDIQEYTGSYCVDHNGKLFFKEGVLVEAMRKGYWIILDELNLAPTEVMEALNRVLDDNRELFLTETQEVIKAHPKFMVFATQNPPGSYGGRKILSRAFRNRFIELHFGEIPPKELEVILSKRCHLPSSYCRKMVSVMKELQIRRKESGIFAGKQGFITLRDLFRWGDRYRFAQDLGEDYHDWLQHIADEGFLLLAGKVRRKEEEELIKDAIQMHLQKKVDPDTLFSFESLENEVWPTTKDVLSEIAAYCYCENEFEHITWTYNMRRIAVLVAKALKFKEPVLLIGNTGCGKTTVCQMFADMHKKPLYSVNCHMHSESADFLGNLRPVRSPEEKTQKLFEWVDGPLINAMKSGSYFLADEVSLADDSVLERLNSVLEPEKTIRVTEKGGDADDTEPIVCAKEGFSFLATMNPGGDYGKKELSPALRNRFTEIWCYSDLFTKELFEILLKNLSERIPCIRTSSNSHSWIVSDMVNFLNWFRTTKFGRTVTVSIRDVLTWLDFINVTASKSTEEQNVLTATEAFLHGACLVFVDGLGSSRSFGINHKEVEKERKLCYNKLLQLVETSTSKKYGDIRKQLMHHWKNYAYSFELGEGQREYFSIGPFEIPLGPDGEFDVSSFYALDVPTTRSNAVRILRAMMLKKPILLEGSPGVGKTSLITALAKASGYPLVRINLSEQTDISDLFGADLPVEKGEGGQFAWRDGPLLQAIKSGSWIILDELNLASQQVLEGLNACLDHRREIFVSELGKTFKINNTSSRIFGCQNPFKQGGSRKGLPMSFLNRFTQVYMEPFPPRDLKTIAISLIPTFRESVLSKMVEFNEMVNDAMQKNIIRGADLWNFNLRDIFRWCEVVSTDQVEYRYSPGEYVNFIYADRMRTVEDKKKVLDLYTKHFGIDSSSLSRYHQLRVTETHVQLGHSFVQRKGPCKFSGQLLYPLHVQLQPLESLMKCMEMKYMAILVGPPASGKTAMVQYLADLTGNTLKVLAVNNEMDTTELLGGFEQADFNRQVEQAFVYLEPLIQSAIAQCLVATEDESGKEICEPLVSILSSIHVLRNTYQDETEQGVGKDLSPCEKKLNYISDMISIIEDIELDETEQLLQTKKFVKSLSDKIKKYGVSAGGRFEWVNSVLVTAVRDGYWLLIEDVNFCSPSVLDRLNGLLEKNGVLTLSEQGAVKGKIQEIKPHQDFRFILSMDPQHGEISPAMRNRGVEIALTSDCMRSGDDRFSLKDTTEILQSKGIIDHLLGSCLTNLYNVLVDKGFEKPSCYDFFNISSLCIQYLQKNQTLHEALEKSVEVGFIKNIFNDINRIKSLELVQVELNKIQSEVGPCFQHLFDSFPVSLNIRLNCTSSFLKQQTCLFNRLLDQLAFLTGNRRRVNRISHIGGPIESKVSENCLIQTFIIATRMLFENCSVNQWWLMSAWLSSALEDFVKSFEPGKNRLVLHIVNLVSHLKEKHFDKILYDSVSLELMKSVGYMVESYVVDFEKNDVPIDPRWNYYLHRRLVSNVMSSDTVLENYDVQNAFQCVESLGNRFQMITCLPEIDISFMDVPDISLSSSSQIQKRIFLRTLSAAAARSAFAEQKLCQASSYLKPFFQCLSESILKKLKMVKEDFDEKKFWSIWKSRSVLRNFVDFCKDLEDQHTNIEDFIELFRIYWVRLVKYVPQFFLEKDGTSSMPSDLTALVRTITETLDLTENPLNTIRSKLFPRLGYPSPFNSEQSVKLFMQIKTVCEATNFHRAVKIGRTDHLQIIVDNYMKWSSRLTISIKNCLCITKGVENFADDFTAITGIGVQLHNCGILDTRNENKDDVMDVTLEPFSAANIDLDELAAEIGMLPLYDYFFVQGELLFLTQILNLKYGKLCNSDWKANPALDVLIPRQWLLEMGLMKVRVNIVEIGQYLALFEKRDLDKKEIVVVCLAALFRRMQQCPSSTAQDMYIYWHKNQLSGSQSKTKWSETEPWWAKQSPVLTSVCLKLLEIDEASCEVSLKHAEKKYAQIKTLRNMLWSNWDFLKVVSVKESTTAIVTCWYWGLISALSHISEIKIPDNEPDKIALITEKLGLNAHLLTINGCNVLVEAGKSVKALNEKDITLFDTGWMLGRSFCFVGISTLLLFAVRDVVDPTIKKLAEYSAEHTELQEMEIEWFLREWQCRAMTGLALKDVMNDCHPYVSGFRRLCIEWKKNVSEKQSNVIYRPSISLFKYLKADLQDLIQSLSLATLLPAIMETNTSLLGKSDTNALTGLAKKFLDILPGIMKKITSTYGIYQDLIYPFLTGIEMLSIGLQIMSKFTTSFCFRDESPAVKAHNLIEKICIFPMISDGNIVSTPVQIASFIINNTNVSDIISFCAHIDCEWSKVVVSLSFSALHELINETFISEKASAHSVLPVANSVFAYFLNWWKEQDEIRQKKKEQEESLFQRKTISHEGETEEVLDRLETQKIFPSYLKEFLDFLPPDTEELVDKPIDSYKSDFKEVLSEKDYLELWSCHTMLMMNLTIGNMPVSRTVFPKLAIHHSIHRPDYVTSFLLRYQMLKSFLPYIENLDASMDAKLIGSHILAASSCLPHINLTVKDEVFEAETYDIYHDSNVKEVMNILPVLEQLNSKVKVLLNEFPENPLLIKIQCITERVSTFSVKSPLVKFVTGLELILESAELWEKNAIRRVSLQPYLGELTKKIVSYRKKELNNWSNCLNYVSKKQLMLCAPWWFHIYSLIFSESSGMEKIPSILALLQQFMEDSSLGEFAARLSMMETFYFFLNFTAHTKFQKTIRNILFNIYTFYEQFWSLIQRKVEEVRKGIAKEIQDMVKISQWSDKNLFTVRKSVIKSHRTLHKCIKRFEKELKKPACAHFVLKSKVDSTDLSWWSQSLKIKEFTPKFEMPIQTYQNKLEKEAEDSIFDNLGHYSIRVKKFNKSIVKSFPLMLDASALNELCGDIIEHAKELQNKEVKKDADLEHQKKEAKLILHQRRKGLADLFKTLISIGLSYKKGLVNWESFTSCKKSLEVPILTPEIMTHFDELCSTEMATSCWNGTNHYYFKCVAQIALLEKSIQSTTRELKDATLIEKCKGFAGHLFKLSVAQRQVLGNDMEKIISFNETLDSIREVVSWKDHHMKRSVVNANEMMLPPQDMVVNWEGKLSTLLTRILVTFQQLEILLKCCPQQSDGFSFSVLQVLSTQLSSSTVDDQTWIDVMSAIRIAISEIREIINTVSINSETVPVLYSWQRLYVIYQGYRQAYGVLNQFCEENFKVLFMMSGRNKEFDSLATFVSSLNDILKEQMEEFLKQNGVVFDLCREANETNKNISSIDKHVKSAEKLLFVVLKSIGNFYTFSIETKKITDEIDSGTLSKKLFSEKIFPWMSKAREHLNIQKIARHTRKIAKYISLSSQSHKNAEVLGRYFFNIVPILCQYSELLKLYVSGSLAVHRTSCKLLSVLLGIFNDVVQKGFCIPPELLPPAPEKGNATEFHDIEKGGLGEGEGMKDVSKDIKTEDQLDDVDMERPDKEEEASDLKDEKDGIEMSEDFEGTAFSPETDEKDDDDNNEDSMSELDDDDLDKTLGDIGDGSKDTLKEQLWGDKDEDDDISDLDEDDCGQGVEQNQSSELAAKDNLRKDKSKQKDTQDDSGECPDLQKEEEYEGEHPDPMIDVPPPMLQPDGLDLPENMEIDDGDANQDREGSIECLDERRMDVSDHSEFSEDEERREQDDGEREQKEAIEEVDISSDNDEESAEKKDGGAKEVQPPEDNSESTEENAVGAAADENRQVNEDKAQAAENPTTNSSHDNIAAEDQSEKWEGGGSHEREEQHKQGLGESLEARSSASEHKSKIPTARKSFPNYKRRPYDTLRKADETRTLGDRDQPLMERHNVSEKTSMRESQREESMEVDKDSEFEHVKDGSKKDKQAMDVATEEQASVSRPRQDQQSKGYEGEDIITLGSSSSEEEEEDEEMDESVLDQQLRPSFSQHRSSKKGQIPDSSEAEVQETPDGEIIPTLGAEGYPESSFHTHHDMWTLLSVPLVEELRKEIESQLVTMKPQSTDTAEVCHKIMNLISPLMQELCEQLRLVLEPTKISKLKGDYRTGKRLNMRKIISYIASQFRKDKIWLRRTKPSKRQYQILLAVDDSSSMSDNHSKELAFESLLLLGSSLALIEAGELAVMSFGEKVELLHSFNDTFSDSAAVKLLGSLTFSQNKTAVYKLLKEATAMMVQAKKTQSKLMASEISQLLVIISDGRNIFSEGEESLKNAIRAARGQNVFIVFIILDSPLNKDSIFTIKRGVFSPDDGEMQFRSYIEDFPFPFYVVLRNIESLPNVLGEALRQWFELVTSIER